MTGQAVVGIKEFPGKGRGVYALAAVPAGWLIDSSPVLVFPDGERCKLAETQLKHYYFHWDEESDDVWRAAVALGLVSICNHSPAPNARFVLDYEGLRINLFAIGEIGAGEEITINYDCDLWFEVKD